MSYRTARYSLIGLGAIAIFSLLSGVGGLLLACHSSALIPANFHDYGNCHATDTPAEVFGSFAMIGLILAGPIAAIVTIVRLTRTERGTR